MKNRRMTGAHSSTNVRVVAGVMMSGRMKSRLNGLLTIGEIRNAVVRRLASRACCGEQANREAPVSP